MKFLAAFLTVLSLHSLAFADHFERKLVAETQSRGFLMSTLRQLYWVVDTDSGKGHFQDCLLKPCRTLAPFEDDVAATELTKILSQVQERAGIVAKQPFLLNTFGPSLGANDAMTKFFINSTALGFTAYSLSLLPRFLGPEAKLYLTRSVPIATTVGAIWGIAYYMHHLKAQQAPQLSEDIEAIKARLASDNEPALSLSDEAYNSLIRGIQFGITAQAQ